MSAHWDGIFPNPIVLLSGAYVRWDGMFPVYYGLALPSVVSASVQSHTRVRVTFSATMLVDAALLNPGNYVITGPTTVVVNVVSVVVGSSDTQVDLDTSESFYGDSLYTVTVSNVQDMYGSVIDPAHNSATFLTLPKETVNIIWVATTGNDSTGTGSQTAPYLTIDRALTDFERHDQIRIMDGTYTPTNTIVISNLEGSIFAENPLGVTIQPVTTSTYGAAIAILGSGRFSIQGINIIQSAANPATHTTGIYASGVTNFTAYECSVSAFDLPAGTAYGILVQGSGRIEKCSVTDISALGIYGIASIGMHIIDCTVSELAGRSGVYGISVTATVPPP